MKKCWFFIFVMCFAARVYASVSIDPLRVECTAKPGEQIKGFYTVTNTKKTPVLVTVKSKKYFTLEENKNITIDEWITIPVREFRLDGGASKEVDYEIRVPEKVEGFLMVLNTFTPYKLDDQGNVKQEMLNTAFSVPVYIRIEGKQNISAEIEKLEVGGDAKSLSVMVAVRNNGNTYLRPNGEVDVMYKNKKIGMITLKEGWPVFPGKSESYRGVQDGFNLKRGTYTLKARIFCKEPDITLEKEGRFTVNRKGIVKNK